MSEDVKKPVVLVVGDNPDGRELISDILGDKGYDVYGATISSGYVKRDDYGNDGEPIYPDRSPVGQVIQEIEGESKPIALIVIFDDSIPKDSLGRKELLRNATRDPEAEARARVERAFPEVEISSDDPVRASQIADGIEAAKEQAVGKETKKIAEVRDAAEWLLLDMPFSPDHSFALLAKLREGNSPYKNTPVIVDGIFPPLEDNFRKIGGDNTDVVTSRNSRYLFDSLVEQMAPLPKSIKVDHDREKEDESELPPL